MQNNNLALFQDKSPLSRDSLYSKDKFASIYKNNSTDEMFELFTNLNSNYVFSKLFLNLVLESYKDKK